ncbi:hypothetical protein B0H66DRAFT_602679 [Apodospora peruviana]|uniref:Uncharacterized protein n=1 Tax=Apodospora peruviana TaxID=516989 RepID=A0AAE0M468_9PEZI|nr:hypothetical protein B0H66DRAFT_602679 [Apodospora peruviana]
MASYFLLSCLALLRAGAAANPLPLEQPEPTAPCITYLTSYVSGFVGSFTPEVVYTVYTTTSTVLAYVPCHGCLLSMTTTLAPNYGGVGPQEIITARTTAKEPYNITRTVCFSESSSSSLLPPHPKPTQRPPPRLRPPTDDSTDTSASECVFTIETSVALGPVTLRTRAVEPTTTQIIAGRHPQGIAAPTSIATITVTLTRKFWSATTISTRYDTCRRPVGPGGHGALPKRDDDEPPVTTVSSSSSTTSSASASRGECGGGNPPQPPPRSELPTHKIPTAATKARTSYATVIVTGTRTRTTVLCTTTVTLSQSRYWSRV